ncbi:hypothetical protein O181_042220 [Austropuccinia psidii MF-1]|uniref:Uncharacterized protein n=1 Tax=Austropuccinia psidii MF-1 TaxID=1389203 RepID=A0A9Q3DK81_9BASI|nr:hypothetical protein [Austropuccinia psidii MF-1]
MLTPAAMPTAPDKQLLKEFYQRFSSAEDVQIVAQNSEGVKLISEAQVQTLRDAHSRKRKICPKQHPDEQLGDWAFNQKYWHSTIKEYKIEPESPDRSDSYSVASSIGDESVDLNAEHDVDNNFLEKEIIENEKSKV